MSTHGVILAAGRGSRLGNITDHVPKGMVKLSGYPMLEWQFKAMREAGVSNIYVVAGYKKEVIEDHGFTVIENPDWDRANMVSSLACALERISGTLIVSYSDIVYGPGCIRTLLRADADMAITYDPNWLDLWGSRFEDPLSDAETFCHVGGRLLEIGNKPLKIKEIQGQFMGLMKIGVRAREWVSRILGGNDAARLRLDSTSLLQKLVLRGHKIEVVPIYEPWCEIDSASDLLLAESLVKTGRLKYPVCNEIKES
ncbi:MAG: NTP transferase domain-containing protein [Pseudomonadota bacterium]